MSSKPVAPMVGRSVVDYAIERLSSLCVAVGVPAQEVGELFVRMLGPSADQPLGQRARWRSELTDDHTPFELTLDLGQSASLGFTVEPLAQMPSLRTNRDVAAELLDRLTLELGLDLRPIQQVTDLFLPAEPQGSFCCYLSARFSAERAPELHVILNPAARGKTNASAIVEEALVRLGHDHAWPTLTQTALRRGPELDELIGFQLALSRGCSSRVQLHTRHHWATPEDLETAATASPSYRRGELVEFVDLIAPEAGSLFVGHAPLLSLAFAAGLHRPSSVTARFPVRGYAPDDLRVMQRVLTGLRRCELPEESYLRALQAHANRPLDAGAGLQSHVSFRRERGEPHLSVDFPVEAYAPGTLAAPAPPLPPRAAHELVSRLETCDSLSHHPFLQRLRRGPVHLNHLWKLVANADDAMTVGCARRYEDVLRRVEDPLLRRLLSARFDPQHLAETRQHVARFQRLLPRLDPWRAGLPEAQALAPGHRLDPELAQIFGASDLYEALGALLAGEVVTRVLDEFLVAELRRQRELTDLPLDGLLYGHGDALAFAQLLPETSIGAAWRGAYAVVQAGWTFLDELYDLCYSAGGP